MPDDPYQLNRFIEAQAENYARALAEMKRGRKESHWMWYIFPQLDGLGHSATAKYYSLKNQAAAEAYLQHPVLGARLVECGQTLLETNRRSAFEIFGSPDDLKLRSCATLFAHVSPADSVFQRLIEHFYDGEPDRRTLQLLATPKEDGS